MFRKFKKFINNLLNHLRLKNIVFAFAYEDRVDSSRTRGGLTLLPVGGASGGQERKLVEIPYPQLYYRKLPPQPLRR